jgi:flagellar basal-body rod modification protein FlgD
MSSTSPIGSSTSSASAINDITTASGMKITPEDFLRLITTQMKDQNPLQPSDPTQFLTQLEQMSQVSSLQSMQGSLTSLEANLQSTQMANGAALIGKTVLVPSNTAEVDSSGGAVNGAFATPTGTKTITVSVTDATGALVKTFQVAPATSGLTRFTWNGTNSAGQAAPAGKYTISASAGDGKSSVGLNPLIAAQVQSVTVDSSTSALDVTTENGTVPLSSVVALQ